MLPARSYHTNVSDVAHEGSLSAKEGSLSAKESSLSVKEGSLSAAYKSWI